MSLNLTLWTINLPLICIPVSFLWYVTVCVIVLFWVSVSGRPFHLMPPWRWFCCLLTVWVGAKAVGALSVPGGHPCRQRLPQLQGERVLPLRQLQSRYEFWGREAPSLLVPLAAAWQKAPPCGTWRLHTPAVLAQPWHWVLYYVQRFCR